MHHLRTSTLLPLIVAAICSIIAYHCGEFFGVRGGLLVKAGSSIDLLLCICGYLSSAKTLGSSEADKALAGLTVPTWRSYWPIHFLGCIVGLLAVLHSPALYPEIWSVESQYEIFILALAIASFFLIPDPTSDGLLWINPIFWSVFNWMLVSSLFGLTARWLTGRRLLIAYGAMLIGFVAAAYSFRTFLLIAEPPIGLADFPGSLARSATSFLAGVLLQIHADDLPARPRIPSTWLLAGFGLMLVLPVTSPEGRFWLDGVVILIAYPVLVWLASGGDGGDGGDGGSGVWRNLIRAGTIAYVVHYPILKVMTPWIRPENPLLAAVAAAVCPVVFLVLGILLDRGLIGPVLERLQGRLDRPSERGRA